MICIVKRNGNLKTDYSNIVAFFSKNVCVKDFSYIRNFNIL